MSSAAIEQQATAIALAFLRDLSRAELEDVPRLRLALGAVAATSVDGSSRGLASVSQRGPVLLAQCDHGTRAALDLLGDLIDDLDQLDDEALLAGLRRFARAFAEVLPRAA